MDVIFDVDGTLLNISHRLHLIGAKQVGDPGVRTSLTNSKRWKEFRDPKLKGWDEPILLVILTMNALHVEGHRVIIASGRIKSEGPDTIKTLKRWVPYIDSVPMYMREDKDYRPDDLVKSDLLHQMRNEGFNPTFVFDDRPSVIRMWREQGLLVADVGKGKEF